jgi:hypothetical protein
MDMDQLDLFEVKVKEESLLIVEKLFEVSDRVKVKKLTEESMNSLEPEDYYYLKDFENKKGIVTESKRNEKSRVISYKVEFDRDKFGCFYEQDLILL